MTETKSVVADQALTVTNQPAQETRLTSPSDIHSDSSFESGTGLDDIENAGDKIPQESNNNTPVIKREPIKFQAELECLSNSFCDINDVVSDIPCTSHSLATSTVLTPSHSSPVFVEQESLCSNPARVKEELLTSFNLKLTDMMETVGKDIFDENNVTLDD